MARVAGSAPEMEDYTDKVRTSADGMKRYYRNGMLHREPTVGPAVEYKDGSGECYVYGALMGDVYSAGGVHFESKEDLDAYHRNVAKELGAIKAAQRKPTPKYLPSLAPEPPKHRDQFGRLGGRVRGSSMADLQKLYSELHEPIPTPEPTQATAQRPTETPGAVRGRGIIVLLKKS